MTPRALAAGLLVPALAGLAVTGWTAAGAGPAGRAEVGATALPLVAAVAPVAAPVVPGAATGESSAVDPGWAQSVSSATGIPAPAVTAYGAATLTVQREDPGCRVGWTTLAGIGWVESHHGTLDGRVLGSDGRSDRPVLGPALDGHGAVAAVRPHRGWQRWHGDPDWEHAVGPMQFLGASWEAYGADGDRDGTTDPQDLDDAALAAAHLLCDTSDLEGGEAWSRAVLAYNHSEDYLWAVHDAAQTYADRTG